MACALDYLHHHCEMAFIHCDLKPSNILLDGDLCAHVSDFGLVKIYSTTYGISIHQQSSSIGIRGTIGYVAPGNCLLLLTLKLIKKYYSVTLYYYLAVN